MPGRMRYALLGDVTLEQEGTAQRVPGALPRTVLAMLLLNANRPVGVSAIADVLWGDQLPASAMASLYNSVLRLRRLLGPEGATRLRSVSAGYLLEVGDGELDLQVFKDLCGRGREAQAAGQWAAARERLAAALELWRCEPLADVERPALEQAERQHLHELRLQALQGRIEADLRLGLHTAVVPELRALTRRYPLTEAFHAQLVLALYRSGRPGDALNVYQEARAVLQEELGADPGPELRRLYEHVLHHDPALDLPGGRAEQGAAAITESAITATAITEAARRDGARHQLPVDTRVFTGRSQELDRLVGLAAGAGAAAAAGAVGVVEGGSAGAVVILAIDGMAGVGKTGLAVHAAHRLRASYPDGQLFIDLHGHTPGLDPLTAEDALEQLLHALGVAPQLVPKNLDERAAHYRHRLADSRVLIVLDDASSTAQVRPLLPGTPGCLVLVTSRKRLTGLDDAHSVALDVLPEADAAALLHEVAGPGRITADLASISELLALCGSLPLAVRITAARLRHQRNLSVPELVERLRDESARLSQLQDEDRSLVSVFECSYRALPAAEQRLFRLLGLVPGPDFDVRAAARLADVDQRAAEVLLESLLGHNLLTQRTPGRYRFHDLVRLYARMRDGGQVAAVEREAAVERLLDHYQQAADAADRRLARQSHPGAVPTAAPTAASTVVSTSTSPAAEPWLSDRPQALAWMRTERDNLLAALSYAARRQHPRVPVLTAALAAFLQEEGPWEQAAVLFRTALTTARARGDRLGEADALWDLGKVRHTTGDLSVAAGFHEQALAIYRSLGNRLGEANALHDLARTRHAAGDFAVGADLQRQALELYQCLGHRHGTAVSLYALCRERIVAGDFSTGADLLERALAIYRSLGDRLGEANSLWGLGRVRLATGDYPAAAALHERALTIYQELGHQRNLAYALMGLGRVRLATGSHAAAADLLHRALAIHQDIGDRLGEVNTLHEMGRLGLATRDHPAAAEHLGRALAIYRDVGDRQGEVDVLNSLGALSCATSGARAALSLYEQALELARRIDSPLDEARALEGAARCTARTGDPEAALPLLRRAVTLYQGIGAAEAQSAVAQLAVLESDARYVGGSPLCIPQKDLDLLKRQGTARRGGTVPRVDMTYLHTDNPLAWPRWDSGDGPVEPASGAAGG